PAFELMNEKGWLGQKNGVGFYRHRGKKTRVNELAENALRAAHPGDDDMIASLPTATQLQQARERMVLLMVNEAALCWGENLTADARQIDLAMILGTGWAPHRGGPLRYAADRGMDEIIRILSDLAQRLGPRFAPSAALRDLAKSPVAASPRLS